MYNQLKSNYKMTSFKSKHSTGETEGILDNALNVGKPMMNVSEYTGENYDSATAAAADVPSASRTKGMVMVAKNSEGETKGYVYGASSVTESDWTNEENWKAFCPCSGSGGGEGGDTPAVPDYNNVIYINQTVSDPAGMITGDVQGEAVTWIRENSHRYVGTWDAKTVGTTGVSLKQLNDSDGTKYADGTDASSDLQYSNSGNSTYRGVFMKMPEFWYYGTEGDNAEIHFATSNPNDDSTWCHWDGNILIGAYEAGSATVDADNVYSAALADANGTVSVATSCSGNASAGSISQSNFKTMARCLGEGFQLVDWQMHCVMCALFYAWYGNANSQAICGSGTSSYTKETGQTDSLGMTDTTTENGNSMSINFWGLENWWGNKYEWIDNITSTSTDNASVESPDPYPRSFIWYNNPTYGKHYKIGKYLDMSSDVSQSGSNTTYYCDCNYGPGGASRVARRSVSDAYPDGGVSFASATSDASYTYAYCGSRVGFRGVVTIVG